MSSRRSRSRGVTLIELLVVITIQVVVLGSVTALLCYTLAQVGQNSAGMAATQQATTVMRDIGDTVRESYSCSVITQNGIDGLRCKMPGTASDSDADGTNDVFSPQRFGTDARPSYASGQRIWYYLSDSTGVFGNSGMVLWRALRTDDNNPGATDTDKSWSQYYTTAPRFPLVTSIGFVSSNFSQTTTVTLKASAAENAADRSGSGSATADIQSITLSETLPWRSDFE